MKYSSDYILWTVLMASLVLQNVLPQESYSRTSQVLDLLTNKSNYDRRLRPHHGGKTVNTSISLLVSSFGKLREIEMDLSLELYIRHYWNDPRLKHSLEDDIVLNDGNHQTIWLPDSYFINVKTIDKHESLSENSGVRIKQNGDVTYSLRMTLTTSCHMDFHLYPVDEQICNLTISSYSFDSKKVEYHWKLGKNGKPMIKILNKELAEFFLQHIKHSKYYVTYHGWNKAPFAEISVVLVLRRRFQYAVVQIFVPTFLIVALSWLSFWIDKKAVPARLALGVTTVLTMVTLMGSFRSALPKVSYIKAVDIYFIISLLFVFFAVFEYVAVLLHSGMEEQKRKSLRQVQNHDAQIDADEITENDTSQDEEAKGEKSNTETSDSLWSNDEKVRSTTKKESPSQHQSQNKKRSKSVVMTSFKKTKKVMVFAFVKNDADVIDRVCRYSVPGTFVAFNVGYILYFYFRGYS